MLKVLDLFSGIGGFSLGLERAGMRTIAFCEIDPFCRAVLRKHWPDVPIFEDVRTLSARDVPEVDLICGGYPCQPFSTAGKRMGSEDDRSLWPEYLRLVREIRPTWFFAENVTGHITLGLDGVLSDLEGEGYSCRPFVIPACAVDAKHRRDRIWIVAYADSGRLEGSDSSRRDSINALWGSKDMADPTSERCSEVEQSIEGGTRSKGSSSSSSDGGKSSGWARWESEPNVGRVANGVPSRVDRLRALGNAVVPQIPEIIGRAILAAESEVLNK